MITYEDAEKVVRDAERALTHYANGGYHTEFDRQYEEKRLKQARRVLAKGPQVEAPKAAAPASYTVICQWTGLPFEAPSKRYKTHPGMAITNDWPSSYRNEFADAVRAAGAFDAPAVTAVCERIVADLSYAAEQERQRETDRRNAAKDRHYARNEREHTNSILRVAGYRWQKTIEDEESMDFAGPNAFSAIYGNRDYAVIWILYSPDDRAVSVREAMTELAARDNSQAIRWLADNKEAK